MSNEYWKGVLDAARTRLEQLRERRDVLDAEREEVNLEIVQVEQVVANLTPLVAEARREVPRVALKLLGLSLSDACRQVLQALNRHMTPIEVRDTLDASGYDLSQHKNPLASIHGVLKRLAEAGDAEAITHDVRGTMYRWKKAGGTRVPGSTAHASTPLGRIGGNGGDPPPAGPADATLARPRVSTGDAKGAFEQALDLMRKVKKD
ncbi:MAG TPA: hypothetical protein VJ866_02035 [Pyrinomonadaceae bacterium]|nr:hypothetical protein [Pyrinomonadaceae bacterium]